MRSIAALFRKSPFGTLQSHVAKVAECVALLRPLFEALIGRDEERIKKLARKISRCESEADAIKNDIRDRLPRFLFMPAARSDLLVLLEVGDGIADAAEDVAGLLGIRMISVPESFREDLLRLVEHAVSSSEGVLAIFDRLPDLLEGSFRGKPVAAVFEEIRVVGEREHDADSAGHDLILKLYRHEEDFTKAEFIIWDKLIACLSRVSDLSEKVANRVRMIMAR